MAAASCCGNVFQQHEMKDVSRCRDLKLTEHEMDESDIQRAAVGGLQTGSYLLFPFALFKALVHFHKTH